MMLAHLADVSVRSILLALFASVVVWFLARRSTAALQHAVWTSVVCGMLALLAFGQVLPRLPLRLPHRATARASAIQQPAPPAIAQPVATESPLPAKASKSIDWSVLAAYAYGAVALAFLAHLAIGMLFARRLLAGARAVPEHNGVYESERVAVPVAGGWLHPRILLPPEWREWPSEKLDAVLTHERAHVQRHDGLVAALAGVNRCLFWFHPLAWMLEGKLAELAERACDEFCVAILGDCKSYARLLLEMARTADGSRLRRHALTMAASSHIGKRIDALLEEGRTFSRRLTWRAWAAVALCGIPAVWGAGAVELLAQAPAPPARPAAQASPTAQLKFDVASVRPCRPGEGDGNGKGRGGPGGRGFEKSPGKFRVTCLNVREMMDVAYSQYASDPLVNDSPEPVDYARIRGGPGWVNSDRYTINAETDNPVAAGPTAGRDPAAMMLAGTMFRALLEDRFQLKIHRETEQIPMYALTVARGGLKMKPMEEGACTPLDPDNGVRVEQMFPPGQKPLCVNHIGWDGPNWTIDGAGQSLGRLALALSTVAGRHVLDQTGVAELFIYHLKFAHDDVTPGTFPPGLPSPFPASDDAPPGGPSVFTALGQLSLRLESIKGPHEFIVIDRVERPSEN
jgi:uncharacterized protein (TIGR03435 family)